MTLNQYPHKKAGENDPDGDDWNGMVDVNWDIAGAWELAGAAISTLDAGTQLGAEGWLCGVKKDIDFGALTLAIPQREHIQHLHIVMSGLRTDRAATYDIAKLVFNGDTTATNYYYQYCYNDGVAETQAQLLGTEGYVRALIAGDSNDAGCYGAVDLMVYNYRDSQPCKTFVLEAISPSRTAGVAKMFEQGGGGGYWSSDPIIRLTIVPLYGTKFLCEAATSPMFCCNVYGIAGKDDL